LKVNEVLTKLLINVIAYNTHLLFTLQIELILQQPHLDFGITIVT